MFKTALTITSRSSIAALLGILFLLPTSVQGTIVSNGSFEDNPIPGGPFPEAPMTSWIIGEILGNPATPDQNRVIGIDTSFLYGLAPRTGNIAAAFYSNPDTVTTGGLASLTQNLTTDPTKTYDISLWVSNPIQDSGNFNNLFSVSWNGDLITLGAPAYLDEVADTKTYIISPETAWFQLTIPNLVVTGTATSLVITARNSDWATLVDDVVVTQIPEPKTVIMLGAGILLMGLCRSRRGQVV